MDTDSAVQNGAASTSVSLDLGPESTLSTDPVAAEAKAPLETLIDNSLDKILPSSAKQPVHSQDNAPDRIYPEYLLHQSHHGNQYYNSFQKYTRQFMEDNDSKITQFTHTHLWHLMGDTISNWDGPEPEASRINERDTLRHSRANAANSLFSWSSGDKYIAARKLELRRKNENKSVGPDSAPASPTKAASPVTSSPSKATFRSSQRLNLVVEKESNRFIQDRIEIIKAHHMKRASERISQRKRDDHEMHLRRLKLKEEKYAKALKAAIASQNTRRNTGFFGSLFGFKPISKSFTLDLLDADSPVSSPITTTTPMISPVVASPAISPDAASNTTSSPSRRKTAVLSPKSDVLSPSVKSNVPIPTHSSPGSSPNQLAFAPNVLDESSLDEEVFETATADTSPQAESGDLLVL